MASFIHISKIGLKSLMVLSLESSIISKRSRLITLSKPLWKRQYSIQVNPSTSSSKSFEKIGVPPPPPPHKPSSPGGRSNGIVILTLFTAFAGYYYKDDIMKQFKANDNQTNDNKKSDSLNGISKEIKPSTTSSSLSTSSASSALTNTEASMGLAPTPISTSASSSSSSNDDNNNTSSSSSSKDSINQKKPIPPVLTNSEAKNLNNPKSGEVDYNAVRQAIVDILDDEKYDDGSYGPLLVRLAWHASGTYDKITGRGGSDGATMRFAGESDWGANAGLHVARSKLEPIKAKFPGLSYADLWVLAGSVAIEEMGGPKINFRSGRKDAVGSANLPDGLLPDADGRDKKAHPADHLRDIFYRQGFNDQEIVALSGAHALGRCHTDRSGFWGPWTRAPTTFSNEYFKLLLDEQWKEKKTHQGKPWTGPFQYEDKTGELMMLPTDLALVQDPKMKVWVEKYAKDENLFFDDFVKAWIKLTENGVRRFHGTRRYYFFGPRE